MSYKATNIIKQYLSDLLGVEVTDAQQSPLRDSVSFNAHFKYKTVVISVSSQFIEYAEEQGDIIKRLESLDILSFLKNKGHRDLSIQTKGLVIDSADN